VPAGLNNIVGLKPTLGAISASGVVPACRSLDTVSVFALSVDDAYAVFAAANCYDKTDAYARRVETKRLQRLPPHFRVGVPGEDTRTFFGDRLQSDCFAQALRRIESLGGEIVEIDFTPFYRIAELLYEGAWVAERYTVVEDLLKHHPEALHPVTRKVIARAGGYSGVDVFRDIYRLKELERDAMPLVESVDMLCVPTAPTFYTVAEVEADPLGTNARLGTYTNFVNLMDMCGIAVPVAPRPDGRPGSVTLLAPAGADARVATLARNLHRLAGVPLGTTGWTLPEENAASPLPADDEIELAVVGAHMSGLPLNGALTRLGARFLRASKTAPCYRLYSLPDGPPFRPGLVRDKAGASIDLETWAIPKSRLGEFVSGIPQPLGIGTLTLYTNEQVKGFICESAGLEGATELTNFGGWRQYLSSVDQRKTGGFYGS
jgi:allophanate hydrolase